MTQFIIPRPAAVTGEMGLVKDTNSVKRAEIRYGVELVGYTARWNNKFRVYVKDVKLGVWHGPYPLNEDDLQPFEKG